MAPRFRLREAPAPRNRPRKKGMPSTAIKSVNAIGDASNRGIDFSAWTEPERTCTHSSAQLPNLPYLLALLDLRLRPKKIATKMSQGKFAKPSADSNMFCPKDCFANSERNISWRPFESAVNKLSFAKTSLRNCRSMHCRRLRPRTAHTATLGLCRLASCTTFAGSVGERPCRPDDSVEFGPSGREQFRHDHLTHPCLCRGSEKSMPTTVNPWTLSGNSESNSLALA